MSELDDVKVGDLVISHHRTGKRVLKVEKITSTQIVTTGGLRYRKKDGFAIGSGGFYYDSITVPKEGEVESIIRSDFIINVCRNGVKVLDQRHISYEQAIKIKEILNL